MKTSFLMKSKLLSALTVLASTMTYAQSPDGWRGRSVFSDKFPLESETHVAKVREFYSRRPRPWRGWPGCRRART